MAEAEHNYVLGRDEEETERLASQQALWGPITEAFLDRLDLPDGARVAELGCGPGLVLPALRERAGAGGSVLAIDGSEDWLVAIDAKVEAEGWENVTTLHADLRELELDWRISGTIGPAFVFLEPFHFRSQVQRCDIPLKSHPFSN